MIRTTVGYAGGTTLNPDYRHIGDHSETIRVEFDPQRITYAELLEVYWESHDPFMPSYNRQYRNAVLTLDETQRQQAEQSARDVARASGQNVRSSIEPAGVFYPAEDYHQKYLLRRAGGILAELQAIYPDEEQFAASTAAARINGYLGCYGEPEQLERELGLLGLSPRMQQQLIKHVAATCRRFKGLTCPARAQQPTE